MLLETIGERIVPGHEVGNEGAPRERGLDLVRLDLAEHRGIDSRQLGLTIGGVARAEPLQEIVDRVQHCALGAAVERDRVGGARDREAVAGQARRRYPRRPARFELDAFRGDLAAALRNDLLTGHRMERLAELVRREVQDFTGPRRMKDANRRSALSCCHLMVPHVRRVVLPRVPE